MAAVARLVRRHALTAYAGLAFAYLLIPIGVVVAFSFNAPHGRFNYTWQGFTFDNWLELGRGAGPAQFDRDLARDRCTIRAGRDRARHADRARARPLRLPRARRSTNLLVFLPMSSPEIVLGASLLTLFLTMNIATGFVTILIAHIMFNISYVVVTVKARLIGFDRHLEEAAMDLGANEWTTFRKVTLPLIAPGVLAAGLLAFALSVDDFVITNFNAGTTVTFPLFVWGAARVGAPPQVNVIGSAIFFAAIGLMLG